MAPAPSPNLQDLNNYNKKITMAALRYFVDEAGDTTLFSRHGKSLDASAGVSRFFMVARLEVGDIAALQTDMDALRPSLLADPLLKGVPSMLPGAGKTARFFHAKDDCAEARHAVFKLLLGHELRLWGVVKEKRHLLHAIRERQAADPVYRYKANGHALYDELIDRLFDHHAAPIDERHVTFAVRGNKARTAALKTVLDDVDARFEENRGYRPHGHTTVHSAYPSASAGLQACDYLLWALQRFYETGKDRPLAGDVAEVRKHLGFGRACTGWRWRISARRRDLQRKTPADFDKPNGCWE